MTQPDRCPTDRPIDFDFYRAQARTMRQSARNDAFRALWRLAISGFAYFKFPQKRWMRRQASSRSSVLVA
jgi:hypothetical protein